jgi:hypothetical protein
MTEPDPDKRRTDRANANFRNIRLPPALRVVRVGLRVCDLVSSSLAGRLALQMFLTPTHRQAKGAELELLERAAKASIEAGGVTIESYRWGEAGRPVVLMVHAATRVASRRSWSRSCSEGIACWRSTGPPTGARRASRPRSGSSPG